MYIVVIQCLLWLDWFELPWNKFNNVCSVGMMRIWDNEIIIIILIINKVMMGGL